MTRILSRTLAAAILVATAACASAAPAQDARAQQLEQRLDAYFAPLAARHDFSGVIRVEADGLVVEQRYGRADWEADRGFDADTLFGVGSVTKGVTAAIITELARANVLSLDDPINAHLPAFALSRSMTIRHVLTHRAGLPRDVPGSVDLSKFAGGLIGWLNTQTLAGEPGAERSYSNVGYEVLALIVEAATGESFADAARERALAQAGLRLSYVAEGAAGDDPRAARGYGAGPPPLELARIAQPRERAGASGLVSNPRELIQWLRAVNARRFPGLFDGEQLLGSFIQSQYEGRSYIRAQGTTRGYAAGVAVFPDQGVAIAYATNAETWISLGIEDALYAIVFDAEAPETPPARPTAVPLADAHRALVGVYRHPQLGPFQIAEQADGLYLHLDALSADFYLTPIADGDLLWRFLNTTFHAERGPDGGVVGLSGVQQMQRRPAQSFSAPRVEQN